MFSVSPAELATITIVALLVFGPHRLPEIARKIGKIGREVSRAVQELKIGIEREYDKAHHPLDEVRRQFGATIDETQPDNMIKRTLSDAPSSSETEVGAPQPKESGYSEESKK